MNETARDAFAFLPNNQTGMPSEAGEQQKKGKKKVEIITSLPFLRLTSEARYSVRSPNDGARKVPPRPPVSGVGGITAHE